MAWKMPFSTRVLICSAVAYAVELDRHQTASDLRSSEEELIIEIILSMRPMSRQRWI